MKFYLWCSKHFKMSFVKSIKLILEISVTSFAWKEPNLSEDWDLFTGGVAQLWCFLSGCSVLLLHLLHLISKHHRDDDVPVIYAGKSSWLRLLLVCHHAVWQLSIHLLLQPDACHGRAPLNCERGVNIIISFASGLPDNIFRRTDTPRDALHSQAGGPHLELAIDFRQNVFLFLAMKTAPVCQRL